MTRARRARPRKLTPALLRRWPLPELDGTLGKEARGSVMVIGGSDEIPGAVMLAAIGALRAGAGTLQIATSANSAPHVAVAVPEARVIALRASRTGELAPGCSRVIRDDLRRCDTVLLGPGMMDPRAATEVISSCARIRTAALVVDAGALAAVSGRGQGRVILTPHAGEMANLMRIDRDDVVAHPLEIARDAAARFDAVIVLKGAHTYVVAPDGASFENTAGNLGLGTSGSGDTLSGVIAGLSARGAEPIQAAVWGVFLHAKAGDVLARKMGPLGYLARELLSEIPALLAAASPARRG